MRVEIKHISTSEQPAASYLLLTDRYIIIMRAKIDNIVKKKELPAYPGSSIYFHITIYEG